jgi:hypothetical protein
MESKRKALMMTGPIFAIIVFSPPIPLKVEHRGTGIPSRLSDVRFFSCPT